MRDIKSLLVKENGDGGDCAFDSGLYYSCYVYLYGTSSGVSHEIGTTLRKLKTSNDLYFRHPNLSTWWSWPTTMSRDQSVSLQCLMVTAELSDMHRAMLAARKTVKSPLLHTNTEEEDRTKKFPDIVSPFELGLWIRSFSKWYLYPVLCVLDLDILLNLVLFRWNKLWDHDAALINKLIATETKYPTPISKLTKLIYRFYDVEKRINDYYNGTEPGHRLPELSNLAVLAFRKLNNQ